jgi:hypothetical protein
LKLGSQIIPFFVKSLKGKSYIDNQNNFEILKELKYYRVPRLLIVFLYDESVENEVKSELVKFGKKATLATLDFIKNLELSFKNLRIFKACLDVLGKLRDERALETILEIEALNKQTINNESIQDSIDVALFRIRGY